MHLPTCSVWTSFIKSVRIFITRREQMTRISSLAFALLILTAFGLQSASAQFKIPDIPRIKKPKAEQPTKRGAESAPAESAPAAAPAAAPIAGVSAAGPDQPTVVQDSIQLKAYTN